MSFISGRQYSLYVVQGACPTECVGLYPAHGSGSEWRLDLCVDYKYCTRVVGEPIMFQGHALACANLTIA